MLEVIKEMILITGLTGTSGSAFYDVLCREKYSGKIRVVVRSTTNLEQFKNSPLDLEFVTGDITDVDFMAKAMDGCELVFNIAAKVYNKHVAAAILRSPSVKKAVFVSSTIVYSNNYPTSTLHIDEPEIRKSLSNKGVKCVFLRPTMIFGTRNDSNISRFIVWINKYKFFPVVKHGSATIQPVSRLDLAEMYYAVLDKYDELQSDDYIISGDKCMTLLEMFKIIARLSGKNTKFVNIPFGFAKFLVNTAYVLSFKRINYKEQLDRLAEDRAYPHEKITAELGYSPLSFEERVKPLIDEIMGNM